MNINLKNSFFRAKTIFDSNTNFSSTKKSTNIKKNDLLDYATLKKMHGIQPDIELYEYKYSYEALLISELKKSQ